MLIAFFFFTVGAKGITGYSVLENISLLRITSHDKIVAVAWTLSHEILFYSVFLLFILGRTLGLIALFLWVGLIGHSFVVGEVLMPPYLLAQVSNLDYGVFTNFVRLAASPINLLFALGVAAFLLYKALLAHRLKERIGGIGLIIGGLIFLATCLHWLDSRSHNFLGWDGYNAAFGIAAFFLMIGMLSSKADAWSSKRPVLITLGDASFSIYLVHYGMQRALLNIFGVPTGIGIDLFFVLLVSSAILCGLLFYRAVEAPLLAFFGRGSATHRGGSLPPHHST